uniref:Yippee domain-containing protein n=1 Tax=Oryzias melastigma TaxID=30732 RepID=A0A3B3BRL0_ORYME
MVKMTKSKTFQAYLPSCHRTYSCIHCRAHLANHDELISKECWETCGSAEPQAAQQVRWISCSSEIPTLQKHDVPEHSNLERKRADRTTASVKLNVSDAASAPFVQTGVFSVTAGNPVMSEAQK